MANFWRSAGALLSRRTAATLVVVLLVTIGLGIGLQRLDFSTGQNSYIDPASQVAKDNERYQNLFGGENMVVLFTVDEGKSVVDLFTPANVTQFTDVEKQMLTSDAIQSVVSPLTLLQWTQDLITKGVASEIIAHTIAREPDPAKAAIRQQDAVITTLRLGAAGKQDMSNPDWPTRSSLLRPIVPWSFASRCRPSSPTLVMRCWQQCLSGTPRSTRCRRVLPQCTTCYAIARSTTPR